jgi:hypothetical protein
MPITVARATRDALRKLPTSARPAVDPADVMMPDGYQIEPAMAVAILMHQEA